MNVLYILVPLALALAGTAVAAFVWAVRQGQYDDVHTPAIRMLLDDEEGESEREVRHGMHGSRPVETLESGADRRPDD